ncbi:hypothetical protein TSAR_012675 [Trichomalopsis sarcophagae]|uniref:Uncharacterized protein n=1 Tax=Trichomalopsis sarcophagae TaxID=543379 RepID=A0A232EJM3_9HYME|nr:hypothetical protein TSAR_012675 [Trichomalopsis sarcophagae]
MDVLRVSRDLEFPIPPEHMRAEELAITSNIDAIHQNPESNQPLRYRMNLLTRWTYLEYDKSWLYSTTEPETLNIIFQNKHETKVTIKETGTVHVAPTCIATTTEATITGEITRNTEYYLYKPDNNEGKSLHEIMSQLEEIGEHKRQNYRNGTTLYGSVTIQLAIIVIIVVIIIKMKCPGKCQCLNKRHAHLPPKRNDKRRKLISNDEEFELEDISISRKSPNTPHLHHEADEAPLDKLQPLKETILELKKKKARLETRNKTEKKIPLPATLRQAPTQMTRININPKHPRPSKTHHHPVWTIRKATVVMTLLNKYGPNNTKNFTITNHGTDFTTGTITITYRTNRRTDKTIETTTDSFELTIQTATTLTITQQTI